MVARHACCAADKGFLQLRVAWDDEKSKFLINLWPNSVELMELDIPRVTVD